MTQLPAGAAEAMPLHGRDLGPGCFPGGVSGIQTLHSPALGRWPGGTPRVAAVLGPRFDSAGVVLRVVCGLGPTMTVFLLLLQALTAQTQTPMKARRVTLASSKKVGPNVVWSMVAVGLIETIRVRGGRLPWLGRHVARLRASVAALGLAPPPTDLADLARMAAGSGERIVRLELRDGHIEVATREVAEQRRVA